MAIDCADECEKSIGRYDDYINCRSKCERNYHIACVDLAETTFVQLKEDGSIRKWSCPKCRTSITSTKPEETKLGDTSKLELYINDKINKAIDNIVNSVTTTFKKELIKLTAENKSLYQEIKQLKLLLETQFPIASTKRQQRDVTITKDLNLKEANKQIQQKQSQRLLEKKETEADLGQQKIIETENKNATYSGAIKRNIVHKNRIELKETTDQLTNQETDFTTVIRKQRRKSQLNITRGTAITTELKGITRYAHLHVYGFEPNTSDDSISRYLATKGINKTKIEKLQSKRPEEYASYKVSVPYEMLDEAKKPELWPAGVNINRFLERIWLKSQQKT